MMKITAVALFALFVLGCSTTQETTTDTTVEVREDTLAVPIDTMVIDQPLEWEGDSVDWVDVVEPVYRTTPLGGKLVSEGQFDGGWARIEVDLSKMRVHAVIVPDTVWVPIRDTVTVTNSTTVIQELSFWDQMLGYAKAVVVTLLVIGLGALLFRLFGK